MRIGVGRPAVDWMARKSAPGGRGRLVMTGLMRRGLLIRVVLALLLAVAGRAAALETYQQTLVYSEWPEYANGGNLLALPALRNTLARFAERASQRILIRYPGGDAGRQWARAVQRWLVAYGVPWEYIELQAGSGAADEIALIVVDRGG